MPLNDLMKNMGYVEEICPTCKAHLFETKDGSIICLNGCHLSPESKAHFDKAMKEANDAYIQEMKHG